MTISKNGQGAIDLSDYFGDVDTSTLQYLATLQQHVTVNFSENTATVTAEPNFLGTGSLVIKANDSLALVSSNTIYVFILDNGNKPPVISSKRPVLPLVPSIDKGETVEFSITKSDPDNDPLTVKWLVNSMEAASGSDSYQFVGENTGNFSVQVIVSDSAANATATWTVTVLAPVNRTQTSAAPVSRAPSRPASTNETSAAPVARCGNNIVEEGENCAACPEDVVCSGNTVCSEGVCAPKSKTGVVFLAVVLISGVIGGAAFLAYKLNSTKTVSIQELKSKEGNQLGEVKERPAAEILDFYKKGEKVPDLKSDLKQEAERPLQQKPEITVPNPLKETPLQRYIREMKGVGKNEEEIRNKLKAKGWKESEIELALKSK